jgi:GTP-binding protein HflX
VSPIHKRYYVTDEGNQAETFVLIGLTTSGANPRRTERNLQELARLVISAGGEVAASRNISIRHFEAGHLLTRGKAEDAAVWAREIGATGVVFDDDLAPAQQRNLEHLFGIKVLDRTALILDIFARRAKSKEGKLQVELAQLRYLLPRLKGKGTELSRLGGGIGTRGPGETKLETDRRKIRNRIAHLERSIERISRYRQTQRQRRLRSRLPTVAIIGYTNSGKSTLLNSVSRAEVFVEDRLFATLDTTTRVVLLPGGTKAAFIDTVGFINKLPTTLVAAFRATLEEITFADLLLQMLDINSDDIERDIASTRETLEKIGAAEKPVLTVLNKIDRAEGFHLVNRCRAMGETCVAISALRGYGIYALLNAVEHVLATRGETVTLQIPYEDYEIFRQLQKSDRIIDSVEGEGYVKVQTRLLPEEISQLKDYVMIDT